MEISATSVKELREKTGAGFMDCKKALKECGADMEEAVNYLREKGLASARNKAGRVAAEGLVGAYIHAGGRIGVLVELNCETDFVAKTEGFQELLKDLSLHIAASNPLYLRREDVSEDVVGAESRIYRAQALESGKPENIIDKIVTGKVEKFYKEVCLMEQPFVKDPDKAIDKLIVESIAKMGENISVRRFVRFKVGEGVEKKTEDFAAEVAAQM